MEILKFVDCNDEYIEIDEDTYEGLAFALEWLGVSKDDIDYFRTKMSGKSMTQEEIVLT